MADTELQALPPVGKSVYAECKKCATERYQTVLAHKTATSAKVKCEVCGAQKTYTLPKAQKPRKPNTGAATRRAKSEGAMKEAHSREYEKLMEEHGKSSPQTYSMKAKFEAFQKLNHPTFGLGLVRSVQPDKIEVVFPDVVRSLVHNRT